MSALEGSLVVIGTECPLGWAACFGAVELWIGGRVSGRRLPTFERHVSISEIERIWRGEGFEEGRVVETVCAGRIEQLERRLAV